MVLGSELNARLVEIEAAIEEALDARIATMVDVGIRSEIGKLRGTVAALEEVVALQHQASVLQSKRIAELEAAVGKLISATSLLRDVVRLR